LCDAFRYERAEKLARLGKEALVKEAANAYSEAAMRKLLKPKDVLSVVPFERFCPKALKRSYSWLLTMTLFFYPGPNVKLKGVTAATVRRKGNFLESS
jgi:hypothetical protein